MEIEYDKVALQEYMDQIGTVSEQMHRLQDESLNLFNSCKQQYNRIHTKLEEVAHRAYNQVENAESMRRSAELEYETARRTAENAEDEDTKNAAIQRMQQAQIMRAKADEEYVKASAAYSKASGELKSLSELWNTNVPTLEAQAHHVMDGMVSFSRLVTNGNSSLSEYMYIMDKAQSALYDNSSERATSNNNHSSISTIRDSGALNNIQVAYTEKQNTTTKTDRETSNHNTSNYTSANIPTGSILVGWCSPSSIKAVSVDETGEKTVSITIGGVERLYLCNKSGMAKAYRHAKMSDDKDMIARTSAMFEIETLRENLELTCGENGYTQLGGYHKDVKKQDPIGYESHHIPSQATQDENGTMLPAISITYEDHKHTSSFAGKQNKTYHPIFPSNTPLTTYKKSIIQNLEQGSSGYIDSIKYELLDLRSATGHRYDGGISAYLDAVIDMLATRGIPKVKGNNS